MQVHSFNCSAKPADDAPQLEGCKDGEAAVPGCVEVFPAGAMPVLPAVGARSQDITAYGYWSIYEPLSNGAYFLGELTKIVHVAPQRFESVKVKGSGPCGLVVKLKGSPNEQIDLVAVDPSGIVRIKAATISATGTASVEM